MLAVEPHALRRLEARLFLAIEAHDLLLDAGRKAGQDPRLRRSLIAARERGCRPVATPRAGERREQVAAGGIVADDAVDHRPRRRARGR